MDYFRRIGVLRALARRRRVRYAALAVIATLALVAAIWVVAVTTQVRALRGRLAALESSASTLASGDAAAVALLRHEFIDARPAASRLRTLAWPVRPAAILLGWLPYFGDDIRMTRSVVDRLPLDLESAASATGGAEELRRIYGVAIGPLDEAYRAFAGGRFAADSLLALQMFVEADATLDRSERLKPESPPERLMGWLRDDAVRLDQTEARLRQAVDWGTSAAAAVKAVGDLIVIAQPAIDDIDSVLQSGQLDIPRLAARLQSLEGTAARAREAVHKANLAAPAEFADSDLYAELPRLESVLRATELVAVGGARGLLAGEAAFKLISEGGSGLLSDGPRLLEALRLMDERHDDFVAAARDVEEALTLIAQSVTGPRGDRESLLKSRLTGLVERVAGSIVLARDLPGIAPELLGAEQPKTYLLLGQTSDELRAGGGFVSGVWLVTFSGGELVSNVYQDVVEIDDLSKLALYPKPPELLEKYMNAPVWLLRDATWEPDFPSTAEITRDIYRLGTGRQVDGVMALTPWTFLRLAEAFGALETPNGLIPADELLADLERGTDAQGRQYMDAVFQGLLDRLDGPEGRARVLDIGAAAQSALEERQILVYLDDPEAQRLIEGYGWSGKLADGDTDRVIVVDSNVGWSKVDRNIERGLTYRIELAADGPARATLTLRYRNLSVQGRDNCDSQFADRDSAYESLKNACYWNLVRAYLASGAEVVSSDLLPLPRYSVAEAAGVIGIGTDTVEVRQDSAGTYVAGLLTVPPADSRTVSFVYAVPDPLRKRGNDSMTYSLSLQPQPGTLGRDLSVQVVLPDGYRYDGGSIIPDLIQGRVVRFRWLLLKETVLTVDMIADGETLSLSAEGSARVPSNDAGGMN
ncbi:MAG: DUF4012 domain-containing protein [Chloroflexi bacterium]|nr:DUF4012 domain-containing protein [Chloroflexota bacterium]